MQTMINVPKQPEQSTGASARNTASEMANSNRRPTPKQMMRNPEELKQLMNRIEQAPERMTRGEFALLTREIGYQEADQFVETSRRKRLTQQPAKVDAQQAVETTRQTQLKTQKKPESASPIVQKVVQTNTEKVKAVDSGKGMKTDKKSVQELPSRQEIKTGYGNTKATENAANKEKTQIRLNTVVGAAKKAGKGLASGNPSALVKGAKAVEPAAAQAVNKAKAKPSGSSAGEKSATPKAEEQAPPIAGEQASPTSEKQAPPIAGEQASPASEKQAPPIAGEQATPRAEKQAQPKAGEQASPKAEKEAPPKAGEQASPKAGEQASPIAEEQAPAEKAAPAPVTFHAEKPGDILTQLSQVPPAQMMGAFNQAVDVSASAFEKQKQKTEQTLPDIPTPTGVEPGQAPQPGLAAASVGTGGQPELSRFQSEQSGGGGQAVMPGSLDLGSGEDVDPDQVMAEARSYASAPPEVSLDGEADPAQVAGFHQEGAQQVAAAKHAELAETQRDFGEGRIVPAHDPTVLRAEAQLQAAAPPSVRLPYPPVVRPDVAERMNPQLAPLLSGFMESRKGEYAQGQAAFDAGVVQAKTDTDKEVAGLKAETAQQQRGQQAAAQAEVEGLREQWRGEVNDASSQYDKEAGEAAASKRQEIDQIKQDKERGARNTLSQAEADASKEVHTAKADADKKEQEENEKTDKPKDRNFLQKAWDWGKEKAKQLAEGIKKAVGFIFTQLRKAVKTIFDKAKAAVVGLIEAGRKLIVSAIKGLGTVLKGLVNKVFAKFPGIAKRITGLIDRVVNKAVQIVNSAAKLLKKGVTAALNAMAKTLDKLISGVQTLYNKMMNGIAAFFSGGFKAVFGRILEAAQIAAEIALAFATGGGSVLLQIVKWLVTTLPELFRKATAVFSFVKQLKNINLSDIKSWLSPAGLGGLLVKGLFGELNPLPVDKQAEGQEKEQPEGKGEKQSGLMKVLGILTGLFHTLQSVVGKVGDAINKILPKINISTKSWFNPFSVIYAGAVQALEVVKNPAQALSEGAGNLKEAAGSFFTSIKDKITDVAGSIKSKLAILGKPAELMKMIANKAVDMVLNFIISNPPSALLKAVFKGIEASGNSIIELVRKYIPFADKLIDKIAGSAPVQGLMKPLEGPVEQVGGMIDEVTGGATNMVQEAEQKTGTVFGDGAKLLTGLAGSAAGKEAADTDKGKEAAGGDFLSTVKGGIHTHLLAIGKRLLQSGKNLAIAGWNKAKGAASKVKDAITGAVVKFTIGRESHELWIEKRGSRKVVMMASEVDTLKNHIKDFKSRLDELRKDDAVKSADLAPISNSIDTLNSIIEKIEAPNGTADEKNLQSAKSIVKTIGEQLNKAEGKGDVGAPRMGDRKISQEQYKKLRKATPSSDIQKQVNKGVKLPMDDPALPGKKITDTLQADHIVSMDKITKMEGFEKLTFEQQKAVLNNPDNFIGLSEAANKSKQAKSFEEWTHYKKGTKDEVEVDPGFRGEMIQKEKELVGKLQKQIDDFNKKED